MVLVLNILGGYASHIRGFTKTYNDIDIFLKCTSELTVQDLLIGNSFFTVHKNVVSMFFDKMKYQIIQVIMHVV